MKNLKKFMAVLVAVMVVMSVSTISVSAANSSFSGDVNTYLISKFDDQDNTGGIGVIDPLKTKMGTMSIPEQFKVGLDSAHYDEYCGTDCVDIVSDSAATNQKALKLWIGDNYNGYEKTKLNIRGIGDKNIVIKESDAGKMYLCFWIKIHNKENIRVSSSSIELSEHQDKLEWELTFSNVDAFVSGGLVEDKWVKAEIPISAFQQRAGEGDMKLNMIRIFINNADMPSKKWKEEDRPYIMIDEITLVERSKAYVPPTNQDPGGNNQGGTTGNPFEIGDVNETGKPGNTTTTSSVNSNAVDTSSLQAGASSLATKPTSSASDTTSVESKVESVANTSSQAEEEGSSMLLWIIIGVAVVLVLGGGAAVLLILKKKPAATVETETPTDAE